MKTRENTTRYVILGVLDIAGSLSGYDIRRWISQTINFFWAESYGQIYPELVRLEKEKLIAPLGAAPAARARRAFRITTAGRKALRSWLQEPAPPERLRIDYLLKLFFGRQAEAETNRRHIASVSRRHGERLEAFRSFREALDSEDAADPNLVYWLIVLRHGLLLSAARCRWAEESLALLEAHRSGGNRAALALLKKQEKGAS